MMKKLIIVDGNGDDEAKVAKSLGDSYDITSVSYFDLNSMALSALISMANTIDSLDAYSGGRALRVAVCARDIAKNLGWDETRCQNVYFVALLHDIGMISVPDSILNKPGRLDYNEYDVVKRHPKKGDEILRDIKILDNLSDGVLHHHERWDGSGYPDGLSGETIPEVARVIAIADAYDAMSSDRVYRPRLSGEKIISEFLRCKGGQFDPDMTDVFIFMLKDGYSVDPDIEQTKEASARAAKDGQLFGYFSRSQKSESDSEDMDALTGLFSRSYLNARVGKKISEEKSGALVIIEFGGCGDIKEKYGEEASNKVIRDFSDRLRSLFREADVVCRISFDEFAVFVSGDSGKGVIEKKAGMISQVSTEAGFSKYSDMIKVSTGIAMCQEDGVTFEELYAAAYRNVKGD